jgi:hypothetical protein
MVVFLYNMLKSYIMSNSRYVNLLFIMIASVSCKRDLIKSPAFEVRTNKLEYKVGDSARFVFSGEPDIITFYSGEPGYEYQYRDRTEVDGGLTQLEFSSRVLYGSQTNNLRVVASTDFSGVYDSANIRSATWKDISTRFKLATAASGALSDVTASGKADISDLVLKGMPLYLAYQYVGDKPPATTPTQRTWRIQSFSLTNTLPSGIMSTLATLTSAGWIPVDVVNPANKWTVAADMLQFAPNSTLLASEDWIITKPLFVTRVSPDKGVAIKEFSQRRDSYTYAFARPGKYKITFVASNVNATDQKTVVKEVELNIIP